MSPDRSRSTFTHKYWISHFETHNAVTFTHKYWLSHFETHNHKDVLSGRSCFGSANEDNTWISNLDQVTDRQTKTVCKKKQVCLCMGWWLYGVFVCRRHSERHGRDYSKLGLIDEQKKVGSWRSKSSQSGFLWFWPAHPENHWSPCMAGHQSFSSQARYLSHVL